MPKLKTLEQIFKEKGGYEIVGEVKGADMVGWAYDGPFDELPAQQPPGRLSRPRSPTWSRKQGWAPAEVGAGSRTASSPGRTSARRRAPASSTSPRAAARRTSQLGKEEGLPPVAPLDEYGVFLPGFGALTGKSAVDPATTDWILDNLQAEGPAVRGREVSAQLPALLALQDGAAVPPGGRVVHRHVVARRDHGRRRAGRRSCPSRSTARPASWTGSRTWATG